MNNTAVMPQKTTQIDVKTITPKVRAQLNPKSRKCAMNAMCCECIYDKSDVGTWRQQIGACTSTGCPLYQLRPKPLVKRKESIQSKMDKAA
jgi:hypothetical protein